MDQPDTPIIDVELSETAPIICMKDFMEQPFEELDLVDVWKKC